MALTCWPLDRHWSYTAESAAVGLASLSNRRAANEPYTDLAHSHRPQSGFYQVYYQAYYQAYLAAVLFGSFWAQKSGSHGQVN